VLKRIFNDRFIFSRSIITDSNIKKFNTDGVIGLVVMSVSITVGRSDRKSGIEYQSGTKSEYRIETKWYEVSIGKTCFLLELK
jgi:hypothetical protein